MSDATPESGVDVLLPELLEPRIAGTIFAGAVHHFACIGSTNAAAMQAGAERWAREAAGSIAEEHAVTEAALAARPRGEVWLAEEQTAGKGRAGHTWQSRPRDGIYLSALLWPRLAPSEVPILSLAAGLAVVEAVHEVTGLWGDLRWPNDVLLGEKKFCGILCELSAGVRNVSNNVERADGGVLRYVVVGMGLNVNNRDFPPELEPIATSLRLELGRLAPARQNQSRRGPHVSRVELVAALLRALDRELVALENGVAQAREQVLRRFERHSSYCCGAAVTVEEDGGYQGITRGLDQRGFLRVETVQGMRTVLSGGVRKR